MKLLDLVTGMSPISLGGLNIMSDGVPVNNLSSNERPLLLSELLLRLKYMNLGIPGMKVVDSEGNLYNYLGEFKDPDGTLVPTLSNPESKVPVFPEYSLSEFDLQNLYSKVLSMKKIDGKTFYNSSKVIVDFLESTITLDYLSDKEYTNVISLVDIRKKAVQQGVSCIIDLTVKYTKENSVIYCKNHTFTLGDINFSSSLDGDIRIEYVDGIVRVVPELLNIKECIISNCVLTYGM